MGRGTWGPVLRAGDWAVLTNSPISTQIIIKQIGNWCDQQLNSWGAVGVVREKHLTEGRSTRKGVGGGWGRIFLPGEDMI